MIPNKVSHFYAQKATICNIDCNKPIIFLAAKKYCLHCRSIYRSNLKTLDLLYQKSLLLKSDTKVKFSVLKLNGYVCFSKIFTQKSEVHKVNIDGSFSPEASGISANPYSPTHSDESKPVAEYTERAKQKTPKLLKSQPQELKQWPNDNNARSFALASKKKPKTPKKQTRATDQSQSKKPKQENINAQIIDLIRKAKDEDTTPLTIASFQGDVNAVKILLEDVNKNYYLKGRFDINHQDKDGCTALFLACAHGYEQVVEILLATEGIDFNTEGKSGSTPLMLASYTGHVNIVKRLLAHLDKNDHLKESFDINHQEEKGRTALFLACAHGHEQVVETLLTVKNIDVNKSTEKGNTPLFIASEYGHNTIVNILLENGADTEKTNGDGDTPLYIASQNGHDKTVNILLENGADTEKTNGDGTTPLLIASQNGHNKTVNILLENGADTEKTNDYGNTPLYMASQDGHNKTVNILLENGADTEKANNQCGTPLLIASQNGHNKTVNILLENGADTNKAMNNGNTPLIVASNRGHTLTVMALLKDNAEVNLSNNRDRTALYYACGKGHRAIVLALLKYDADCNAGDDTALMMASQGNFVDIANDLIGKGADVNKQNQNGTSPLMIACSFGHLETIATLLDSKDININAKDEDGLTAVMSAIHYNNVQTIREVFDYARRMDIRPEIESEHISTEEILLALINDNQHSDIIQLLSARNIPDDEKSEECFKVIKLIFNDTRLKRSDKKRYAKNVSELFKNGYDLNSRNKEGQPLIKWCYERGYKKPFYSLLEMDADINQQDKNGDTVLISAMKNKDFPTIRKILAHVNRMKIRPEMKSKDISTEEILLALIKNKHPDIIKLLSARNVPHDEKSAECFKVIELIFNDTNIEQSDKKEYASELFKNGYDPNSRNKEGQPLIKWCYERGYKKPFYSLLEMDADINQQDKNGDTVLISAMKNKDFPTIRKILAHVNRMKIRPEMKSKDISTEEILLALIKNKHPDIIKLLSARNVPHDEKSAECFKVIELIFNDTNIEQSDKKEYASELFKNGYDPNSRNEEGQPLIKWCYEQGYKELFSLLLEMGADINQQDDNGDTVLMSVCKNGDETTVETLFEQREDVDIYLQDKNGLTVEDMALNNCQSAILIRILDYAESLANTDDTASQ